MKPGATLQAILHDAEGVGTTRARGLEGLFPPSVVWIEADEGSWTTPLLPEEEAYARRYGEERRREFRAGRTCAREALRRLGFAEYPLLPGPRRAPLWPPGVVGTITHCRGFCAAAVARREKIVGLGLDAERAHSVGPALARLVCTRRERWWIEQTPAPSEGDWLTLCFTVKEAVYKSVAPDLALPFRLRGIHVELDVPTRSFEAGVDTAPHRRLCVVRGRYALSPLYVLAAATRRQVDPT